jgi:hypothetical protein
VISLKRPVAAILHVGVVFAITVVFAQKQPAAVPPISTIERCTQNCLVTIEGLRAAYYPGERVEFSIQNQTKNRILVAVSVDGHFNVGWVEILASVVEPDRPLVKVVKATPIQGGKAWSFSYDPWTTLEARAKMLPRSERPNVLRLRVYVDPGGKNSQVVPSQTFRIVETKGSR